MKKAALITLFLGMTILFSSQAQAHYPWVNSDNYSPETGDSVHITIGWGHRYPLSRFLKKADLEHIVIVGPDGKKVDLVVASELEFEPENNLSKPGSYIVAAKRKTGFYTKTTQGGKRQSKKGLSNVISCSLSHMSMKAILSVGEEQGAVDSKVGHPLEIIPMAKPGRAFRPEITCPSNSSCTANRIRAKSLPPIWDFPRKRMSFAYTSKTDRQGPRQDPYPPTRHLADQGGTH